MQQHLTPVESRLPRNSEKNLQKRSDGETKGATPPPGRKSSEPLSPSYQLLRRYNRDLLYDEVWKQPMWTLAKKYGISDVGLAKACRKLGVPLPGLGYWAKKAAGKKVPKRPPLPALAAARG
jgi:hypothetical protein